MVTGKVGIELLARRYWCRVRELLEGGNQVTISVSSGSMRPLLQSGDTITVVRISRELHAGDILLVHIGHNRLRLHRLLTHREHFIQTKGDSLGSADREQRVSDILGICVAINGHRIDTPTWRFVNRQIARISPYSHQLRAPIRVLGRIRRALGLWWL
ncbi:MAG: S24/S26 family peptidase [Pseudomonadota bacterium]